MAHITGTDRAQVLLLPDTVDDYVGPDNPVRFIDAFVDSLDLAGGQRNNFSVISGSVVGQDPPLLALGCRKQWPVSRSL